MKHKIDDEILLASAGTDLDRKARSSVDPSFFHASTSAASHVSKAQELPASKEEYVKSLLASIHKNPSR